MALDINKALLNLLNRIWPPERPTDEELIAYGQEMERARLQTPPGHPAIMYAPRPYTLVSQQNGQQVLQSVQPDQTTTQHISTSQPQYSANTAKPLSIRSIAQLHQWERQQPTGSMLLRHKEVARQQTRFKTRKLEPLTHPDVSHMATRHEMQAITIEDCSWLNSKPVTPEEFPVVDQEAPMRVPTIVKLKHGV